jgi:hypothetical protein
MVEVENLRQHTSTSTKLSVAMEGSSSNNNRPPPTTPYNRASLASMVGSPYGRICGTSDQIVIGELSALESSPSCGIWTSSRHRAMTVDQVPPQHPVVGLFNAKPAITYDRLCNDIASVWAVPSIATVCGDSTSSVWALQAAVVSPSDLW